MKKKHVVVGMIVFNKLDYTQQCVDTIFKTNAEWYCASWSLVIFDNASTDGTKEYLQGLEKRGVKVFYNTENIGYCKAANIILNYFKDSADYICMINNDTIPRDGWLYKMIQTAELDPKIAVVGAKVIKPGTDLVIHTGAIRDNERIKDPYISYRKYLTPKLIPEPRLWVNGCCILIKSEVIKKEGVFNEDFCYYFEEADYCSMLNQKGYKVMFCPNAEIEHFEKQTAVTIPEMHGRFYSSWHQYAAKWNDYINTLNMKVIPKIGIIMACYNAEKYLPATLNALMAQSYGNWKLYFVDDCSTDNSAQIVNSLAKQYNDSMSKIDSAPNYFKDRFSYIKLEKNQGVSFARNAAIREILNDPDIDFVKILDSDDILYADHLEKSVYHILDNNADMIYSDVDCRFENGTKATPFGIPYYMDFEKDNLLKGNFIYTSTVMFKKECLSVGEFDSRIDAIEDHLYWCRIAFNNYKVYHYPEVLTTYLVRESGNVAAMSSDEKRTILKTELEKLVKEVENV